MDDYSLGYNPREEIDNLGYMVCWHSRYNLGDRQPRCTVGNWLSWALWEFGIERVDKDGYHTQHWEDFIYDLENDDRDSIKKAWDLLDDKIIVLPLYLYDHSGICMSTVPFSDPWDSGQVGFIYVGKDTVREQWDRQRISSKLYDQVVDSLEAEVEEYNQYLIYG